MGARLGVYRFPVESDRNGMGGVGFNDPACRGDGSLRIESIDRSRRRDAGGVGGSWLITPPPPQLGFCFGGVRRYRRCLGRGPDTLGKCALKAVPGVHLRLVQPNIPQALKWRRELRRSHVQKQLKLSLAPALAGSGSTPLKPPTHIIWAETSVPYILANTPGLSQVLAAAVPPGGLMIFGAPRASPAGVTPRQLWNSLQAIDDKGRVKGTYDKHHLVPFGEYVPFRDILPIEKLTAGRQDFSPGPGIRTLAFDGLPPVSPLICYEVIFSGNVVDAENRPQWLLNLTNDAWFGQSFGPYQHFAAARLRAVEEGLPLVRVANTGISGVIDGYGRTIRRLGLGQEGVIDSPLPAALDDRTMYSRFGGWILALMMIFALAGGILLTPNENDMR